jgi:hypothetical protein
VKHKTCFVCSLFHDHVRLYTINLCCFILSTASFLTTKISHSTALNCLLGHVCFHEKYLQHLRSLRNILLLSFALDSPGSWSGFVCIVMGV